MNRRTAETACAAGTITAILAAVLLFKSGLFWQGSVNQLHSACSAAGALVYLGGDSAVTGCSQASTAYTILMPVFVVSIIAAVAGLIAVLCWETAAQREARRGE